MSCEHLKHILGGDISYEPSNILICKKNCLMYDPVGVIGEIMNGNLFKYAPEYIAYSNYNVQDILESIVKYVEPLIKVNTSWKIPRMCNHNLKLFKRCNDDNYRDLAVIFILSIIEDPNKKLCLTLPCNCKTKLRNCIDQSLYIISNYVIISYRSNIITVNQPKLVEIESGILKNKVVKYKCTLTDKNANQSATSTMNIIMSYWLSSNNTEYSCLAECWFKNGDEIVESSDEIMYDLYCILYLMNSALMNDHIDSNVLAIVTQKLLLLSSGDTKIIGILRLSLLRTILMRLESYIT